MSNAIERITLENFQSHQSTEIAPAPLGGLTVIIGPSGHGKTAVLRALRWLLYNQPQGTGFMRKSAQMVKVAVELADGSVITRRRTAGTNQYIAVTEGSGRQVFEGFGTDVPLEIQQLTGVRPSRIADLTLTPNLARQLDGPFLGEEAVSAGVRAKVLGRIAGVDEVDHANKTLATDQFRRGQEEKRLEREAAELAAQEARYAHLPELRKRIDQLEALAVELARAEERRAAVTRVAGQLHQVADARRRAQDVVGRWGRVLPGLEAAIVQVAAAAARRSHVTTLATRGNVVQESRRAAEATLGRWAGAGMALDALAGVAVGTERRNHVTALAARWRYIGAGIQAAKIVLTRTANAAPAAEALTRVTTIAEMRARLLRLRDAWQHTAAEKLEMEVSLKWADQVQRAFGMVGTATEASTHRLRLFGLGQTLARTRMAMTTVEVRAQDALRQADEAAQGYVRALTDAGRCPVCGSEIHPEHVRSIA